jgi:glycosyltransferase involved in cell wall biosynthesis
MNEHLTVYINTLPVYHRSGGMKTFLLELLQAFAEKQSGTIYRLICSEKNRNIFSSFEQQPGFEILVFEVDNENPLKRIFFEQFLLNKHIGKTPNAALLNICNVALLRCSLPQITIVQAQMSIKELRKTLPTHFITITGFHKIYYDLMVQRSARKSAITVCISEYMKPFINVPDNRKVVIHEGVNIEGFKTKESASKWVPSSPYILSLSTLFPHKNTDKLIQAFKLLKDKTSLPHKLLIAGKDPNGKQLPYLKEMTKELGISNEVIFTGWVEANEVPALYKHASVFLYISSMEFFGLPVLEAMACDVPVIAGNKMSIPEVVNDAGILLDPNDINAVALAMEQVLTNQELREDIIIKGRKNMALFSWANTAEKFEKVFRQVLKNP